MRLIDAEQLKRDLPHDTPEDLAIAWSVSQIIDNAHTVDNTPVVHAHWIKVPLKNHPDEYKPKCSNCECLFLYEYNYCPNCGAKMYEEV